MFVRDRARVAAQSLSKLSDQLSEQAEAHLDWAMPGYTHLQRAQPVYLSHHLLAYAWMFVRDRDRFAFAARAADVLPLGAGALAGVNFDTDRRQVADELGFAAVAENSIDAVSNRDFVLDYLSAAATCATHLSRLGAELVLWSTSEFGFCELPDAWSSGSSIMPQKKNPDAAELLRAKAPRVVSHLVGLLGTLHALPLTYNKDMQEDKQHLFDAVDTLELSLAAAQGMLGGVTFNRDRMEAAAGDEFLAATDVADLLVRRGMPFRQAHGVVAGLVRSALEQGKTLSALTPGELAQQSPLLDDEFYALLRDRAWLESKVSQGGTSLDQVRRQLGSSAGACRTPTGRPGEAGLLRPARRRGSPRSGRMRGSARRMRGRDRGDRGLPRLGAGVSCLRRAHATDSHAIWSAGAGLRLSLVRGPRHAERGLRAGGGGRGGVDPGA